MFLHDLFFIVCGLSGEDSRGHNQINYFVISDYFTSLNSYLQSKSVRAATIIYNLGPLNILEFLGSLKKYINGMFQLWAAVWNVKGCVYEGGGERGGADYGHFGQIY